MTQRRTTRRPAIHMINAEADRLEELALAREDQLPQVCQLLLREIGRATIHNADRLPAGVVSMGSKVRFVDEDTGATRTVQLVYPGEADIDAGRISILTPVGAGLIGLSEGQSIRWPDRDGRDHILSIVKVERVAEAA